MTWKKKDYDTTKINIFIQKSIDVKIELIRLIWRGPW